MKLCLYDEKCKFARKAPCRIKLTAGQKMQIAQTSGKTKRGTLCKLHILTKNEKFCLTAGLAGVTMWANQNHGNGAGQVHPARRFCYLSIWLNAARKIEEAPWFDLERSGLNMYNSSTVIWVLVAAFLVYFMQAGFALCEAGLTRAKNTGNILMKNMMDFCIGTPCFWLVGFGIMFAGSGPYAF